MSEYTSLQIRAFTPPFAGGVGDPRERINYLMDDYMTDHVYPYGVAGRYWKLEAAFVSYPTWSQEALLELATPEMLRNGWTQESIQTDFNDPQYRDYLMEECVEIAIRGISPSAIHNDNESMLTFVNNNEVQKYVCRYFYTPLPDPNTFTMIPILFEDPKTPEEKLQISTFLDENHSQENIFGARAAWESNWHEFWDREGITQEQWNEAHTCFWKALWSGQNPDEESARIMNAVRKYVIDLLIGFHRDHQESKKD